MAAAVLRGVSGGADGLRSRLLADVPLPADDPFHAPVVDLAGRPAGDLVADRRIDVCFLGRRLAVDAHQIRFVTSKPDGTPAVGVASVLLPDRRRRVTPTPLLAYQPAIDSLGPAGDPSYGLRRGDHLELPVVRLALRKGWAVVLVDWTGPQHSFVDLPLAARFVLDGIRATLRLPAAGLGVDTPVGLWGYSGGALATSSPPSTTPATPQSCAPSARRPAVAASTSRRHPRCSRSATSSAGSRSARASRRVRPSPTSNSPATSRPMGGRWSSPPMTMDQLALSFPLSSCSERSRPCSASSPAASRRRTEAAPRSARPARSGGGQ